MKGLYPMVKSSLIQESGERFKSLSPKAMFFLADFRRR